MMRINLSDQAPDPKSLYAELSSSFGKTLDRAGKGEKEENNDRQNKKCDRQRNKNNRWYCKGH